MFHSFTTWPSTSTPRYSQEKLGICSHNVYMDVLSTIHNGTKEVNWNESHIRLLEIPWTIQFMEFSRPEYWKPFPSSGDLPNPGIKPRSPALQADSLPAEPQGNSKNTGVDSLLLLQGIFLFQGIFPTQELNRGLLHCRRILYQLSHWEAA